jgi:hypothetical protein
MAKYNVPTTKDEMVKLVSLFNRGTSKKETLRALFLSMQCEHGYMMVDGHIYHFDGTNHVMQHGKTQRCSCHHQHQETVKIQQGSGESFEAKLARIQARYQQEIAPDTAKRLKRYF